MLRSFKIATVATILAALPAIAAAAPPASDYVRMAGASDLFEKASSKLVLATTKDKSVKSFANMMVKDHNKSTLMVKKAATKSGVTPPPPALTDEQQRMINELTSATGPARDTLYWNQQKAAHQQALALHQDYASTGDQAPLRTAAGQIVPVVQHHIDMLNTGHAM